MIKQQLSLGKKIGALVGVSIVLFVGLGVYLVLSRWVEKEIATSANADVHFFLKASQSIHELQRERGKSALYLAGSEPLSGVKEQRSVVDARALALNDAAGRVDFGSEHRALQNTMASLLAEARRDVDQKAAGTVVVPKYTQVISQLLQLQIAASRLHQLEGSGAAMQSISLLELAKEYTGRLRANITNALAADRELSPAQILLLENTRANILSNLNSPVMNLTVGSQHLKEFGESADWRFVLQTYDTLMSRSATGRYGVSRQEFYKAVTRSIDRLGDIVAADIGAFSQRFERIETQAHRELVGITVIMSILVAAFVVVWTWFVRSLSLKLGEIVTQLSRQSESVAGAAGQVGASSQELSSSSTEQAAVMQETVAAVEEINAMVNKSADNANCSMELAASANGAVQQGKGSVDEMLTAIADISRSNQDIAQRVSKSNDDFSEVVRVITQVGEKTRVINDIVFQTKLLSFNASVEAARAGEQGKGFAVVAEEVGNLAQMSGTAAKEISEMLGESIKNVDQIVSSTRSDVEHLIQVGRSKVETGMEKANRCGLALDDIVKTVEELGRLVGEIATASKEQAQGVQEITKAMGQLDISTQQNASASQKSSEAAAQLNSEVRVTRQLANELSLIVRGQGGSEEEVAVRTTEQLATKGPSLQQKAA